VAVSLGFADEPGEDDTNWLAREWALSADEELRNRLFARLVEAAQRKLTSVALGMATRIVGPHRAEDIVNDVWEKVQEEGKFDPDVGSFTSFFCTLVHHRCVNVLRQRGEIPEPGDVLGRLTDTYVDADAVYAEVHDNLADLEGQISAAIEALDLPPGDVEMLRQLIGPDPAPDDGPGAGASSPAQANRIRSQRRRLRAKLDALSKLTGDEHEAASLLRKHHSLSAAAKASGIPLQELQRRFSSAKRKIRVLFNIPSED
jgi:RNA polymerase sigma factor (sigma-70 family)